MKTWSILTNSYYKKAHYRITEGPWWVYFTNWLIETIDCIFHHIPLLNSLPKDYPVSDRFCIGVNNRILNWKENKLWSKWIVTDYEQLKKDHPELGEELTKREKEWDTEL